MSRADPDLSLSAAVLAGGASRRMGTDKALLEFAGQPLLGRVVETLRRVSDDVLIVGERAPYHQFAARVLPDAYPNAGTLGGIATALRNARRDHALVVACDMPLLSIDLLQAMAREPRDYDALVPITEGGRSSQGTTRTYETLHAVYTRGCLPAIERRLERRELQVIGFFGDVRVRELDPTWWSQFDPAGLSFLNTNDPSELERARAMSTTKSQMPEDRA